MLSLVNSSLAAKRFFSFLSFFFARGAWADAARLTPVVQSGAGGGCMTLAHHQLCHLRLKPSSLLSLHFQVPLQLLYPLHGGIQPGLQLAPLELDRQRLAQELFWRVRSSPLLFCLPAA